jgi:hypothetical protein
MATVRFELLFFDCHSREYPLTFVSRFLTILPMVGMRLHPTDRI